MKPTGKKIRQDLARAKSAYLKNDELRTIRLLAISLKNFCSVKLVGPERTAVEGLFRDVFSNINRFERVKKFAPKGVPYLKGQEKKLLAVLIPLAKKIEDDINRETLEAMRERKLRIDKYVLAGRKFLEQDNILEAQRNFRAAVEEHVDEDGLFPMLASLLIEKGFHKQSLEYVRQAVAVAPDNVRGYDFLMTALEASGEWEQGEKILAGVVKKTPAAPLLQAHLALVASRTGDWPKAKSAAQKALSLNPGLPLAKKVLAKAEKELHPA